MAVTNPDMNQFQAYMQGRIVQEVKQSGGQGLVEAAAAVQNLTGFDAAKWYTARFLRSAERQDYLILSVYTARVDGEEHKWVGAFKRFFQVR